METAEFDIKTLINYIEREYGIDRDVVISIIEESITKAARKNKHFTNDLRIVVDRNNLSVHVYDTFVVSDENKGAGFISTKLGPKYNNGNPVQEGDLLEIEIPTKYLGRICARESRMLIMQKIKNAKDFNTISEYKTKTGDIVSGTVTGIDRGNIILTVNGRTEMVIPKSERILKEKFKIGDSVHGIILGVNEKQKHSPIVVSRSSKRYIEELMKREVSELNDGTLEIMGVSRDPGHRAKIAIRSNNDRVDPVGSCVGRRGVRINNVKNELSGERIDIIRYSENVMDFIKDALAPARVESIEYDPHDQEALLVTVSPDQYPLAVGRFGNNVRLASELVGHRIHVKKSMLTASFEEQKEYAVATLSEMFDISTADATQIVNSGFLTPEGIAEEDEVTFISSTGLDEVKGKGIYAAAVAITNHTNNLVNI